MRHPIFISQTHREEPYLYIGKVAEITGASRKANVDIRAGWLNYVLTGTELHRYHHSADSADGMNFVYRPGIPPRALGVANPSDYPADREILGVLRLPFSRPQ